MQDIEPLVRIEHLSKTFEDGVDVHGTPIRVSALKDVSFDIFPGEFLAVVGVNGSGKSTLVHCLGSFETPDPIPAQSRGPILCRRTGNLIDVQTQIDWYRQNFVGIVFQAFHLLPKIRVWQNVEIPLKLGHCERFTADGAKRRAAVREVLEHLGVESHFHSRVHQTSGGQRQRIAIARALVKRPSLLLADEPTGNLDEAAKRSLVETLSQLTREGVAVLMVTHDRRYVDEFADRIITLQGGEIKSIHNNLPTHATSSTPAATDGSPDRVGSQKVGELVAPTVQVQPSNDFDGGDGLLETAVVQEWSSPDLVMANSAVDLAFDDDDSVIVILDEPTAILKIEANGQDAPHAKAAIPATAELPVAQATTTVAAATASSLATGVLNPLKRLRLPGCDQRLFDLVAFSLRDAWESSLGLVSNVIAILCGAVLTALLMGLLVGTDRFIKHTLPFIPNIDAVHAWIDYSTGAEPLTKDEFEKISQAQDAVAVVPNIQQFTTLYSVENRETIVTLVSGVPDDPETKRLKLLKGTRDLDPNGWGLLINERVANELDNFNPMGLVGKKITLQLRRYDRAENPGAAKPSKVLTFPVQVIGMVEGSYKDRLYGSLNMVRFVRDFSTGRSKYTPPAAGQIDLSQITPRTMYEGVRLHFSDPWEAESAHKRMKADRNSRLDLYWSGSEMEYLRDVQTIAFLVFLGIGMLTILAGSISVFNTLRASVAHKTSEIGILRALGVTRVDIFFIYIFQSLIIGVLAGTAGLLLAWFFAGRLNAHVAERWEQLQKTLDATGGLFIIPPVVGFAIFGVVCLICVLAASLPAAWAAQRTPMDALNQSGR
jgi:putative ABC transport system ATP-binding protein